MTHVYNDTFFDYIQAGARRSADIVTGHLAQALRPASVLDLGCGRGVWLAAWHRAGATRCLGVDGDYVDRAALAIPTEEFRAEDLTRPLGLEERFDLAQSLEVGEHLPPEAAGQLVESLTSAADRVLFSAAVPGQGGEFHVNERPLSYWQGLFAERGYVAHDFLRPLLAQRRDVEPWYRYNSVLYVNEAGRRGLPDAVARTALPAGVLLSEGGDPLWRLRRRIVQRLPRSAVTRIAQARARVLAMRARLGPGLLKA